MEYCSHSNESSLTIPERELYQSTSAPSSPTRAPLHLLSGNSSGGSGSNADNASDSKTGGDPLDLGRKSHRSVKFPEDHAIVTGYHEAPDPFQFVIHEDNDVESVTVAYKEACAKQNIQPITSVLEQIQNFKCNRMRAQDLILRGQHLDAHQCEALEEILKRVLFRLIDLDSCDLDCDGASALFDMVEFYESASHLSIANNKSIGVIGWQSLCRTLKKTSCLQYLDLSNTGLNEQILLIMGRTIRVGSHLVTLHLENAGLFGRRLAILVSSIKFNTSVRELYLGENKICSADCVQLGNLLRGNGFLNVLDLRHNFIQDIGLDHICEGLSHQPTQPSSVFELFETHSCPISQNSGILILNLSDNQLSSRAMNRLAQALSQCHSLIALDLSDNSIGDEGILILKEGLFQCKTLKYLNISNTDITCEGASAIADVIRHNSNLTILDLSNNNLRAEGINAIHDAVPFNKRITKVVILPQVNYSVKSDTKLSYCNTLDKTLENIEAICAQHKLDATFDEYDHILSGHLRNDISVYNDLEQEMNKENNIFYSCDTSDGGEEDESTGGGIDRKKPLLMRTASLGSWERPVKSGRFSVSPVELREDDEGTSEGAPEIQISVDVVMCGEENNETVMYQGQPGGESTGASSDEDNASDLSQNETDQLADLPSSRDFMNMTRLMPPQRSFRRMSSPAISGISKPPKPKPNLQLKLSGNLESLDLKSSLPLSPTFFAKFDFSDLSLLRLPAEVEEIVSNLPLLATDSEELIFQFENFCPTQRDQSEQKRQQQCVY